MDRHIADGILEGQGLGTSGAQYSFSDLGSLAYIPAASHQYERRVVWVDRKGEIEPISAPPRNYSNPSLSPDGRQVAVGIVSNTSDVWILDPVRGGMTRLTSEAGGSGPSPFWTPDGKRIIYAGTRRGVTNLFWKAADGTGAEERLAPSEESQTPHSVSPDGKFLAFYSQNAATGFDLWMLPLIGDRKPQVFLKTPFNENDPAFSSDGRYLAYTSNESGRGEVYVRPYPGPGGKWQVSTEGASWAWWSRNGRELFYRNGDKVMAVEVNATGSSFSAGKPRLLFESRYAAGGWDVAPDGQRFLMIQAAEPERPATQINVVLNWFEELKQKAR